MAVISIDYEEYNPTSYNSVRVFIDKNNHKNFDTGDLVKDWYNAIIYSSDNSYITSFSSTVDHFIHDTELYDVCYLTDYDTSHPRLIFYDDTDSWMRVKDTDIMLFVNKDERPTFEEYKEYLRN